ncbi:MAG: type II toxin-antitoxin system Phd/YefM family antitoxin [Sphingomonas sp.]
MNTPRKIPARRGWKLEDAKARFSEVVRLARSEGPQRVSVRGRDAVVVMSVEDHERLAPRTPRAPLVGFLEGLALDDIDVTRESDTGRDVTL